MLKAVGTTMIIERVAGSKTTQGGIILQSEQQRPHARVLSVGPQVREDIALGDMLIVDWSKCGRFEHENTTYYLVDETTVLAVVK